MSTHTISHRQASSLRQNGSPPSSVTRALLGCGVIAGPVYVLTSVVQGLTRDGFDLTRHQWSLLENGDLGWIQIANFVGTGAALLAFAVGLGRTLAGSRRRSAQVAAWLTGTFGASMLAAAVFHPDPALGFPPGTPDGPGDVTTTGILHFACAGVGFTAIAVACFIVAHAFTVDGTRTMARFSRVTGLVFFAGFACVASGSGSIVANLIFTAAVVLVFGWIATVAIDRRGRD